MVGVFVGLGIRQVRLTGGEPLLRRSLVDVVRADRRAGPAPPDRHDHQRGRPRPARRAAGATPAWTGSTSASTPSTPTSSPTLTRRDRLHDVEAGLKAAAAAGLTPSRSTPSRCAGSTTTRSPTLLQWCLDRGYELRFIEQMPLDAQHGWDASTMVSAAGGPRPARGAVHPHRRCRPSTGAVRLPSGSSSTAARPPSASSPASPARSAPACDRTRLTADGQVRNCLFSQTETDLRGPLRDGASRRGARRAASRARCGARRPATGSATAGFVQPDRPDVRHRRLTTPRATADAAEPNSRARHEGGPAGSSPARLGSASGRGDRPGGRPSR